jgi:hypothetical protein
LQQGGQQPLRAACVAALEAEIHQVDQVLAAAQVTEVRLEALQTEGSGSTNNQFNANNQNN